MNFYASSEYLDALAAVYFKGRHVRAADVRVGEEVLRLLEVDQERVITDALFLDYHEPLREDEIREPTREHDFARCVSRGIIEIGPRAMEDRQDLALAPFVDWSFFPKFDDYTAMLMRRKRSVIRENERRGRRLAEKLGEPVFRMDDPQSDVLELARQWKSRQLRDSGLRDIFADPRTTEYLALLRERDILTSSTLRVADRLLAVWLGFIYDGTWSGWIFTYDREVAKYSPGHQLLRAMLEESHRRGHRSFDFSIGAEEYKILYASHGRLLGPIGRPPLRRRLIKCTKEQARQHAPQLLSTARAVKRAVEARAVAASTTLPAPPSTFDTAPPVEGAPPPATFLRRAKGNVLTQVSTLVMPVLQRVARDHVGGETIDDALVVARRLTDDGEASTVGFWETSESVGRPVVEAYLSAIERLAEARLDSTLSIKPPAMRFDSGWSADLAAAAERLGVRIHCDSHGPEVADLSHAMENAMLERLPCASLSTTLPGRWSRSVSDAERVIDRGLGVRVVKGQWPDPAEPKRDLRAGYLEVIDRLAGRVRHVGVATHDVSLAAEAIGKLRAAGTPCELELLFGRPMAQSRRWARENDVRVRIYVPFGKGYIPSGIGILRHNPKLAVRIVHSVVAEKLRLTTAFTLRRAQTSEPVRLNPTD